MKRVGGFTLIELMITIAIIGILASIAIPTYIKYTDSAKMTEVIQEVDSYKSAVTSCVAKLGSVTGCNNGTNGIPSAPVATGNVASIIIANGTITATAQNLAQPYTYILIPALNANGVISWDSTTGSCVAAGVC